MVILGDPSSLLLSAPSRTTSDIPVSRDMEYLTHPAQGGDIGDLGRVNS